MKKILSIVFIIAVSTNLFATQGLVVTQKYTDASAKGATIQVTWYVTADQCKMKMSYADDKLNSNTYFIPDVAASKLLTYSDGQVPGATGNRYFSVPLQSIKPAINVSRVSVTQTGETKPVGGILCQKVIVKTNISVTEMWVTQNFKADFYKFFPFFQNSFELMALNQESLQGVPLESVTKDLGGKVISSYQLVSASESDLTSADLSVPAGYQSADDTGK
jgi:hypothetical protein